MRTDFKTRRTKAPNLRKHFQDTRCPYQDRKQHKCTQNEGIHPRAGVTLGTQNEGIHPRAGVTLGTQNEGIHPRAGVTLGTQNEGIHPRAGVTLGTI